MVLPWFLLLKGSCHQHPPPPLPHTPPSSTCSVVRPEPRSGSAEADPAYRAASSRGFCHHMADPGPAASPGVTRAWIRVTIFGVLGFSESPQHDTDVVSAKFLKNVNYSWGIQKKAGALKPCKEVSLEAVTPFLFRTCTRTYRMHSLANGQNLLVDVFATIFMAPCGRCTFQLLHFLQQRPDI